MTETITGTNRSAGTSYTELLNADTRPVPAWLKDESAMEPGGTRVGAHVYYSQEFHDLEVEVLWKRVWQMACHEDEIPDVGDYYVYEIAHLSFLIIRTALDEIKAFRNACLHRGRMLRDADGKGATTLRCAFHGWSWNLDGSLKEIPCQWDFPTVTDADYALPQAKVGRWGGLVFINPDRDAESLEDFLGELPTHFSSLPREAKSKVVHVEKIMPINWKACQEAFMEAYHVVATHPTLLHSLGDANTRYDVYENFSRACSPINVTSPHLDGGPVYEPLPDGRMYTRYRHPMSGHIYERADANVVHVISGPDGSRGAGEGGESALSVFDADAKWISGPVGQADPHLCLWVGGDQVAGSEAEPMPLLDPPDGMSLRSFVAQTRREQLRPVVGDTCDLDAVSDAELVDAIFYAVFPNWHPWGSFNSINYRFRPNGDNPNECIFDVMLYAPSPAGAKGRRPPAEVVRLGLDDDWTMAPALGGLAKIFQQDSLNLPRVQRGVRMLEGQEVVFADYNESKIRHFHAKLGQLIVEAADVQGDPQGPQS